LKVAHSVLGKPGRSGLYESARNLVAAERRIGIDARIVPLGESIEMKDDRGAPIAGHAFMCDSDVLVSHSGTSAPQLRTGIPVVTVLHGNPEYCHQMDLQKKIEGFYSRYSGVYAHPIHKAFVTFYPQHLPFWELTLPADRLRLINPPCDLDVWKPKQTDYDFHGKGGTINIVSTESWRETKIPFDIIHGFAWWAKKHPGAKLHIYGCWAERLPVAWAVILNALNKRGVLGEVMAWSKHLQDVYAAADMTLCFDRIAANTMRESMACGCPVVSHTGSTYAQAEADTRNPVEYAGAMEQLWDHIQVRGGAEVRANVREVAEQNFDVNKSAAQFVEILEWAASQGKTEFTTKDMWYDGGVHFECKQCGKCCGKSGVVRFDVAEADTIARFFGIELSQFAKEYSLTRYGAIFEMDTRNGCPMLENNKCRIHTIKPAQCKTYPFWPENIESTTKWVMAAEECPGISNDGPLVQTIDIEDKAVAMHRMRAAYVQQRKMAEDMERELVNAT